MDIPKCKAKLSRGERQCSFAPTKDGFCTRHYNLNKTRKVEIWTVQEEANTTVPVLEKDIEDKNEVPIDNTKIFQCPVCFEDVTCDSDAQFSCSYFMRGKGCCAIHVDCAKPLRKAECPTCRNPLQNTEKMNIDSITKNMAHDEAERQREEDAFAQRMQMLENMQQGIFGGNNVPPVIAIGINNIEQFMQLAGIVLRPDMAFDDEDINNSGSENDPDVIPFGDDEDIPIAGLTNDDLFAYAFNEIVTFRDQNGEDIIEHAHLTHQMMHSEFPGISCDRIDNSIQDAINVCYN